MTTIVKRATKGAPLTHDEVDANFDNLNNDIKSDEKLQIHGYPTMFKINIIILL